MLEQKISNAFEKLHPKVQRWIWQQGWDSLRDIQEESIPTLLNNNSDLIIAATTASGKTEAAFLPIISQLAWTNLKPGDGFGTIYISPLRALINDQFRRLESLCEELQIAVFKWHGDVAASIKTRARKHPEGIILITPESLEALLMRGGSENFQLFKSLSHIVIDELHAFMNVPRGKQLQSLLNRIEQLTSRRIARVGLSATLPDMQSAACFLRPLDAHHVTILQSITAGRELKLQLRGYIEPARLSKNKKNNEDGDIIAEQTSLKAICQHLFKTLRNSRNLIFAGSRQNVEKISAALNDLSEKQKLPGEFLAHHGSLARTYREDAEKRMKEDSLPVSIVCTTTLELGIDIGNIESVAQIGAGHTVAGMRQRLGRSGRRANQPAIFRVYTTEEELTTDIHPIDSLRPDTIQAIAMIELMLKAWNEKPNTNQLHLSTLIHQILALIIQHGGMTATQLWNSLIATGIFENINKSLFTAVLKRMGHPDVQLLEQAPDGTLLTGAEGERITASFNFYAVFETPEECRVVYRGREIGRLPINSPYQEGDSIILGGKYWRIITVDLAHHEIIVEHGKGGRPPLFAGEGAPHCDEVVIEMKRIYQDIAIPNYLDAVAIDLIHQARKSFLSHNLMETSIITHGDGFLLFPWLGSAGLLTLQLILMSHKLTVNIQSIAIEVQNCTKEKLVSTLSQISNATTIDTEKLALLLTNKKIDKFDHYLNEEIQAINFASAMLDSSKTQEKIISLLKDLLKLNG